MNKQVFFRKVVDQKLRPPLNPKWPAELGVLLNECWHHKLSRRPLCSEVGARLLQMVIEQRYEDAVRTDEQFEVAPQGPQGKKSKLQVLYCKSLTKIKVMLP